MADTLLPASVRAAQQGQDGWSPTGTQLPPATLVYLVIRPDGTFTYSGTLPTDYTLASEGTWQWASLTGEPEKPATYGPFFYVLSGLPRSLWAVQEHGAFTFFGPFDQNGHAKPIELKRKPAGAVGCGAGWVSRRLYPRAAKRRYLRSQPAHQERVALFSVCVTSFRPPFSPWL